MMGCLLFSSYTNIYDLVMQERYSTKCLNVLCSEKKKNEISVKLRSERGGGGAERWKSTLTRLRSLTIQPKTSKSNLKKIKKIILHMIGIETKEIRFEIERIRLYGSEIRSHAVSFRQGRRKASAAAAAASGVGGGI